jgi:lysophospholipase L1-like esterase
MLGSEGQAACGSLMFTPNRILSVRSYTAGEVYQEGRDYTLNGRTLALTRNSRIHAATSHDFPTTDLGWYTITGKQILVSYTHADAWNGPLPVSQAGQLPHTLRLLKEHRPLTIVADGDSITLGLNTSGYSDMPPYMPTWADLFVHILSKHFGDGGIHLYNTGLGGMTSDWGRETAEAAVASLEPDLVLIAFGMNDFWWMPADQFEDNVRKTMETVRKRKPTAEFILIAPMQFDPEYAHDPQYHTRLMSYLPALNALKGPGVAVLDMTTITGELFRLKKPKDIVTDPLHPTDFLARWYAQGLAATVGL